MGDISRAHFFRELTLRELRLFDLESELVNRSVMQDVQGDDPDKLNKLLAELMHINNELSAFRRIKDDQQI